MLTVSVDGFGTADAFTTDLCALDCSAGDDSSLTEEEKALARFQKQRMKELTGGTSGIHTLSPYSIASSRLSPEPEPLSQRIMVCASQAINIPCRTTTRKTSSRTWGALWRMKTSKKCLTTCSDLAYDCFMAKCTEDVQVLGFLSHFFCS